MSARRRFDSRRSGVPSRYGERLMPRWDGGEDPRSGRTYQPIWPRVFAACLANGLTPRQLVDSRFSVALASPPEPSELVDPRTLELAKRRKSHRADDLKQAVASQLQRLSSLARMEHKVGSPDPVAAAVYSVSAGWPVVNYLFVVAAGRQDLASSLFPTAVADFLSRREALDPVIGAMLPDGFAAAADRLSVDARRPTAGERP